jgi:hypothetical protein
LGIFYWHYEILDGLRGIRMVLHYNSQPSIRAKETGDKSPVAADRRMGRRWI